MFEGNFPLDKCVPLVLRGEPAMSYIDAVERTTVPRPPRYYTPPAFETVSGVPVAYRRKGQGETVGETPLPKWFRSFDDLTLLYDQFFEQLGLGPIHLVGFSMGGWAAAEFASFYPRRLKSLTLITPVGLRLPDNPGLDIFQLARKRSRPPQPGQARMSIANVRRSRSAYGVCGRRPERGRRGITSSVSPREPCGGAEVESAAPFPEDT
jgi:pimeloyl-ACP methyl ester carboxylesterase